MAASPDNQPLAVWLDSVRNPSVRWHTILNTHSTSRPKSHGGSLFPALTNLYVDGQENDSFICTLHFPCSSAPNDGLGFQVSATGGSVNEARDAACKLAFAHLIRQWHDWVIFRSNHWNMSADQFSEGLRSYVGQQIRIEPASGGRTSGYVPLTLNGLRDSERDEMIFQTLKRCLARGACDPSHFRRSEYQLLNKYVKAGYLRAVIEVRPDFVTADKSCNKGWTFGWSPEFTPGGSSSHCAPNAQETMANATSEVEAGPSDLASGRISIPPGLEKVSPLDWLEGPASTAIEVSSIRRVKAPGYKAEMMGYLSVDEDERVTIRCDPKDGYVRSMFKSYVYVDLASHRFCALRQTYVLDSSANGGGWVPVDILEEVLATPLTGMD